MGVAVKSFRWGALIRLTAKFTNGDIRCPVAVDPDTVTLRTFDPEETTTERDYVVDTEGIVRDDVGEYHFDIDAQLVGSWTYRWEGTGAAQAVNEAKFTVLDSPFRPGTPS